ncbi:MAG: nickel transporter [Rhodobacterales bacterium]|nr:MAG: nickel transporter [Rhodobacterales bacterium]
MPMSASAHFVLAYTPDTLIESPGDVAMKLIFWHPFENGHVMEMEAPQAVYAVHRGEKIDLSGSLEKMTFSGVDNAATGYDIALPVKRSGDYVVVVEPAPYLEKSEDLYIQQFTKVFVNRNGMPTDWDSELGLAAEILPMVKPYNVIAGSSFTGRVMAAGKPVAGAEIEVEYMAAEPDMDTNAPKPATVSAMPGGAVVIKSDEDGYFTFAIPRAGHWGFAALGVGPVTEHEGKELSQDAVIWVRAFEME